MKYDNPPQNPEPQSVEKIIWQLMGAESQLFMSRTERGVDIVMPTEKLDELGKRATTAIKKLLLDMLPKEQNIFGEQMFPGKHDRDNLRKYGYNQAIAELRQAIKEMT